MSSGPTPGAFHLLADWPQASCVISLSLSCLACKKGTKLVSRRSCYEDEMRPETQSPWHPMCPAKELQGKLKGPGVYQEQEVAHQALAGGSTCKGLGPSKALGQAAERVQKECPHRGELFWSGLGDTHSDVTWRQPGPSAGRQEGESWQGASKEPARSRCHGRADLGTQAAWLSAPTPMCCTI